MPGHSKLKSDDLTLNRVVTISPNKVTGDHSCCSGLWEIVAVNGGHALVRRAFTAEVPPISTLRTTNLLPLAEYDFYPADNIVTEISKTAAYIR